MNWGKGIGLVYITFVVGMLGLVYLAVNQDFDLVAEDYYEQEIAYQGRIDQLSNAKNDNQKVAVSQTDKIVQLAFASKTDDVKIHFFRPSDEMMDLRMEQAHVDSELNIPIDRFSRGKYLVKIEWTSNGRTYFQEQDLIVN